MTNPSKKQSGSAYDLNSVARDRMRVGVKPNTPVRSQSPYTLRGESSLSALRTKTEKNEPK